MLKRVLSALFLLALTAACFVICKETAVIYVAAVGILCVHELTNALNKLDFNPVKNLPSIFLVLAGAVIYFKLPVLWLAAAIVALYVADFVICMKSEKHTAKDALMTLCTFIYPVVPLLAIIYVRCMPAPLWTCIFVTGFLAAVSCDTFALFGGMAFGKHKLAPTVSPNKTIEGSVSGTVVTIGISFAAWFLFRQYMPVELWKYVVTVAVCTVTSQIGDLSASFIKRSAGIKDFGNLIPGHGGMLDRIDSIMFSIPTALVLINLFAGK